MNKFVLLVALLVPSIAAANYPHGYKLTHDSTGKAYQGYFYRYNSYTNKWDRYDVPVYGNDNHSVNYSYTYNYNQASASAGTSQSGLQGAFRYDEYNPGRDQIESEHYTAASRAIDEKRLDNQRVRDVQDGYTRERVLSIQEIDAKARLLKALDSPSGAAVPQVLQQFNSYSGGGGKSDGGGAGEVVALAQPSKTLAATEQSCLVCHGAAVAESKGGSKTHTPFAQLTGPQVKRVLFYVSRLDDSNCAKKAGLNADAHRELMELLYAKSSQP